MTNRNDDNSRIQVLQECRTEFDDKLSEVKNKVKGFVKKCLDDLCENVSGYEGKEIKYNFYDPDKKDSITQVKRKLKNDERELLFIKFTSEGDVVVVGAGYDFGFSENKKNSSYKKLVELKKSWGKDKKTNWRKWILFILIDGLHPVGDRGKGAGIKGCEHILQCRNGIEMYLGEYLVKNNIHILNEDQHKNYSKTYFEKMCNKYQAFYI